MDSMETGRNLSVIRQVILYVTFAIVFSGCNDVIAASIVGSKHDLSVRGPGPTKSPFERQVCIFCHAVHNSSAGTPLWNRYSSGSVYETYKSTTLKANVGQPTGSSKMCLSCHDGTIALGMVRSRSEPIRFAGGVVAMPAGAANLGTDLADDHPISFRYNQELADKNGELHNPSALGGHVRLEGGQVQCTTCHNAHDNQFGDFLVMDNYGSALCVQCHDKKNWKDSSHKSSNAQWNGKGKSPWHKVKDGTVKGQGCESCHRPHTAGAKQRLLAYKNEEDNCFSCHNGNVGRNNIEAEFEKSSRHNLVGTSGVHDPTEDYINPSVRHVECVDCHNPHAVKNVPAEAPEASGALFAVKGINAAGGEVREVKYEYELCYRCHGDSADKGAARIERQFPQTNVRVEFDSGNASFHPVTAPGRNSRVPSLMQPYDESTVLYCTDCHSNNESRKDKGDGPSGPHGSIYEPILQRRLVWTDFSSESAAAYALCYKCHERNSILANESFSLHSKHVADEKTACTTCHDSHASENNTHLINFNIRYVSKNSSGDLSWRDNGDLSGTCNLSCHGKDHKDSRYPVVKVIIP